VIPPLPGPNELELEDDERERQAAAERIAAHLVNTLWTHKAYRRLIIPLKDCLATFGCLWSELIEAMAKALQNSGDSPFEQVIFAFEEENIDSDILTRLMQSYHIIDNELSSRSSRSRNSRTPSSQGAA
jgi:hypothetical protein